LLVLAKFWWSIILLGTGFLRGKYGSQAIDSSSGRHHLLEAALVGRVRNVVPLEERNIIEDGTSVK